MPIENMIPEIAYNVLSLLAMLFPTGRNVAKQTERIKLISMPIPIFFMIRVPYKTSSSRREGLSRLIEESQDAQ